MTQDRIDALRFDIAECTRILKGRLKGGTLSRMDRIMLERKIARRERLLAELLAEHHTKERTQE